MKPTFKTFRRSTSLPLYGPAAFFHHGSIHICHTNFGTRSEQDILLQK